MSFRENRFHCLQVKTEAEVELILAGQIVTSDEKVDNEVGLRSTNVAYLILTQQPWV